MSAEHRQRKGIFRLSLVVSLLSFILLATANSAGYRYGASDLAFYGPAVMRHVDPELFPRDAPIIEAQARLTLMDETVGTLAKLTTTDWPWLFLLLYLMSLAVLAAGAASIGTRLYANRWSVFALLMALSLRHAVPKSGTNTLEAYFHPRQLAFAFGTLAVAAFLRGRLPWTVVALFGAALLHPTTTLWFAVWLGVSYIASLPRWRTTPVVLGGIGLLATWWAVWGGPLAGRLGRMDAEWLATLADKDYLFPLTWPVSAWALNLGYVVLIWWIYRYRARAGLLRDRETALVIGCLSLVVVFLIAIVLHAARLTLAIQLQPARVFWMLDFLALVYLVWALAETKAAPGSARRPALVTALLIVLAAARGIYVMRVEFPGRPLLETGVPGHWGRVMAFARTTPKHAGFLADPNHASLYGTSVRMAAARDVFVEATKDEAVGMYDRSTALRTRDRLRQVDDFRGMSAEHARTLASRHALDYLITEQELELPLAFASGPIRVYHLR